MAGRASSFPKVAVLMGGQSAEREVSLATGAACAAALRGEGYEVIEVDAGRDVADRLIEIKADAVLNCLHGRWGEDGCVQGILEWLRIPYTHSGVLASSLAMDKERTKAVYRTAGLPVARSVIAHKDRIAADHIMQPPYVVKPYNEGSSVGVYIVHEAANAPPMLEDTMPAMVMVEEYVPGRELTVSVIAGEPTVVTEIIAEGWYDYHAKYAPGGSRHVVPADIPGEIAELCRDYALRAHQAIGCRGVSRTDFRWDDSKGAAGLILLETNTQPGMTGTSLTPEQAGVQGMTFGQLCAWMVEDASCDR